MAEEKKSKQGTEGEVNWIDKHRKSAEESQDHFLEGDEWEKKIEEEIKEELIAKIKSLAKELRIPITRLEAIVENKYNAKFEDLEEKDLQKVFLFLEKKKGMKAQQEEKKPLVEAEAPIAEAGKEEWQQQVITDEGVFLFRFIDVERGLLRCKNEANGKEYELVLADPSCSCLDFVINKQKSEYCKHLKAAQALGLNVAELPKLPAFPVKEETVEKRKKVAKREEVVALDILDRHIDMPVQVPDPLIPNEERAVKMIIDILGPNPAREAVIEEFGNIEEISAGVILALAQYTGIRFAPLCKEIETVKMNLGKIFEKIPMDEKKQQNYLPLIEFMPETDVVIRCKMTTVAAWKDRSGNLRIGMGTKDEHLTPFELRDIVMRGANFIETKCETKAAKKAILNALPVTHDGLLQKIKRTYSWD